MIQLILFPPFKINFGLRKLLTRVWKLSNLVLFYILDHRLLFIKKNPKPKVVNKIEFLTSVWIRLLLYAFRTWLKPIRVCVYLCFCNSYSLAPTDPKEQLSFIHQADTKSILLIFTTIWSFLHDVRSHLIKDFKVKIYWNVRSE